MAGTPSEAENQPVLSPDGTKLLFIQGETEFTIASASLSDATVNRLISTTGMATGMPAWARHQDKLVYDTARSGSSAIWMRSDGWDRPLVTADAFPPGTTNKFMTPALSPDTGRLVYTRTDKDQKFNDLDLLRVRWPASPVDQYTRHHRARRLVVSRWQSNRLLAVQRRQDRDYAGEDQR